ncbi:POK18 protein, partial [Scytalopus superciliaris]|nr:POK18 protein [Scytalopus superciliaris]
WPLREDKLHALNILVDEQLQKGHTVSSISPWNSPIFVIKKSNGKWKLLQDLRKINEVLESVGALQPGMPSPNMIPQDWKIVILDIQDCFFSIPLHPKDSPRFAFSVPSVNAAEPARRFQWTVLLQGMKNLPSICQEFVSTVLSPVSKQHPSALIYHYMDDILLAAKINEKLGDVVKDTQAALAGEGLIIAPEKVQTTSPWKYLGQKITERYKIQSQGVKLPNKIQTLHDLQSLLGTINWVRPALGFTTDELHPLFSLL